MRSLIALRMLGTGMAYLHGTGRTFDSGLDRGLAVEAAHTLVLVILVRFFRLFTGLSSGRLLNDYFDK
jgi:hypothetical protein